LFVYERLQKRSYGETEALKGAAKAAAKKPTEKRKKKAGK
jgi:hypothetical protein